MPLPTPEQIEKARLAVKQAKARLQAIENRQSTAERKLETRRKIILGGLLLDAAEKDEKFARALQVLVDRVSREQDAKAFEGWQQPRPGAVDQPGQEGNREAVPLTSADLVPAAP
jgi:hypothetical protein